MIRIAICDDEKHMSDHIRAMAFDYLVKSVEEKQSHCYSDFVEGRGLRFLSGGE